MSHQSRDADQYQLACVAFVASWSVASVLAYCGVELLAYLWDDAGTQGYFPRLDARIILACAAWICGTVFLYYGWPFIKTPALRIATIPGVGYAWFACIVEIITWVSEDAKVPLRMQFQNQAGGNFQTTAGFHLIKLAMLVIPALPWLLSFSNFTRIERASREKKSLEELLYATRIVDPRTIASPPRAFVSPEIRRALSVLGLKPGASEDQIRLAYKELAQTWHPDRFAEDNARREAAQRRMTEINDAHDRLESVRLRP